MGDVFYIAPFWAILLGGLIAARNWAGWPEQAVGQLFLLAALASLGAVGVAGRFRHVEPVLLAIDLTLTLALGAVALRADRWWPMCATSLAAVGALAHLGQAVTPGLLPHAYQFMEQVSSYPAILVWCGGIWREERRRRNAVSVLPAALASASTPK